jgi:hypothetical protein
MGNVGCNFIEPHVPAHFPQVVRPVNLRSGYRSQIYEGRNSVYAFVAPAASQLSAEHDHGSSWTSSGELAQQR